MKYTEEQIKSKYKDCLSENEIEKLNYSLPIIKKYLKWKNRLDNIQFIYSVDDFLNCDNCISVNEKLLTNTYCIEFYKQNYRTLDYRKIHLDCKALIVKRRGSPYDIERVSIKNGISIEEALQVVNDLKNKTSGTKENFIKRHGAEKGELKYNEFINKSKSTKENFQKRYGEKWEERWNNYIDSRDSSSLEYWIKKLGNEEGSRKFDQLKYEFSKSTKLEYYKQKYGDKDGVAKFEEVNNSKANTKDDLKLAGYTDEQISDISMKKSIIYNNLKKIYGESKASEMYKQYKRTKVNPFPTKTMEKDTKFKKFSKGPVSKSANIFFSRLETELGRKLRYGKKSDELMLFDINNKKAFFYDCLDIETNTIIEYNGSAYHANDRLSIDEREEWCNPWGKTWKESWELDKTKYDLAIKNGYNLLVVWDYETSGKKRTALKIIELKEILC